MTVDIFVGNIYVFQSGVFKPIYPMCLLGSVYVVA